MLLDRDTWADSYRKLAIAYNKPLSAEQAGIMFDGLSDLPLSRVHAAVLRVIKTAKHFPSVAEIREMCSTLASEEYRSVQSTAPHYEPISDEQRDSLLKFMREVKEKLGIV
jgi:hypothetical protein